MRQVLNHPDRCITNKKTVLGDSEKDRILNAMILAPKFYCNVLAEEKDFRAIRKRTTSDIKLFRRYSDRLLIILKKSPPVYPLVAEPSEESYHVISVLTRLIRKDLDLHPALCFYIGQVMIRYRIKDQDMFYRIKLTNLLMLEIYQKLVIPDRPKKSVDFSKIQWSKDPRKTDYMRSLLFLHEYLTDETIKSFEISFDIRFPGLFLDTKTNHKKLAESITELYWFEQIEKYTSITNSPDLPETGRLKILSHWFFVDEAEHLAELTSTEYFVRICVGVIHQYEYRE
jgi:hypothetical protein